MRAFSPWTRMAGLVATALAGALLAAEAGAAPQIVAAVPTHGPVALICGNGDCSAEFSTVCLQRSRTAPSPGVSYSVNGRHQANVAVMGHRAGGGTVALAPGVLRITSLRSQTAFRFSVPASFLKSRRLNRLTVNIGRLAVLTPNSRAGDPHPQTAEEVALAVRQANDTGGYWSALNTEKMAMARVTNRVLNWLQPNGSVSVERSRDLWSRAVAPEPELSEDALDWVRTRIEYCRQSALTPSGFPMRRCLGTVHDRYMQDLNTNYWKALKPLS